MTKKTLNEWLPKSFDEAPQEFWQQYEDDVAEKVTKELLKNTKHFHVESQPDIEDKIVETQEKLGINSQNGIKAIKKVS